MAGGDPTNTNEGFTSRFVTAPDGLRLHVRIYGERTDDTLPIVCLPGLARTGADFHALATTLAHDKRTPRFVLALDFRGRGRSDHDRDPANYNLAVELGDLIAVLTAFEAAPAVFVGTSRGGLLTMLLGPARPLAVAGAILNDIGPVIEPKGLMRIKGYVGRLPQPRDYDEGAEILRRLFDNQFPKLTAEDWQATARRTWELRDGRLTLTYDARLSKTLASVGPESPIPALWKEFDSLARVPLMVIRGANSDLLSAETVAAMKQRRPDLVTLEVPDQGHTPLLREPDVIARMSSFIAGCDMRLHA